jgi:hypothetical protein
VVVVALEATGWFEQRKRHGFIAKLSM